MKDTVQKHSECCSFKNVFAMVFCQYKINYDDQNVEIWRRNVQCYELTFFACNA